MRNIYIVDSELQAVIEAFVDHDTGEVGDDESQLIDALEYEREQLLLGLGTLMKEYAAQAAAIETMMKERAIVAAEFKNKAATCKRQIERHLNDGEKLSDEQVTISWRRSSAVEVHDLDLIPSGCIVEVEPRVDKKRLAEEIKAGRVAMAAATIQDRQNLQVK